MSALQPWREQLQADPARVVAGVLDGWLDRGPWQRAEPVDFLLDLADGHAELSEQTATATLNWAWDRLCWDDARRLRFGEISHASRLADAFAVVQRLEAPRAAYRLAEHYPWFESRTRPLQFYGHLDLHRLLWWAIAFQQPDERFVPRWLEFCGRAAALKPDWKEWLRLGITGLRMVEAPPDALSVDQHALAGLLLFHQRLKAPVPEEVAAFERRQLGVLKELFPRGATYWDERLTEARERWPERRDLPVWLRGPGGKKAAPRQNPASTLPTEKERKAVEQRIRREPPSRTLWEVIEDLFHRCQNHAFCTGESDFLIKTVSNLGDKFLKRRPSADLLRELLAWIRTALDWDNHNAYLWARLAKCLSALNQDQAALDISWEALRRFPDDEIRRTSLAELLRDQGRTQEAENLLREAMARFPDNVVCRASLAELLRDQGRTAEAESLLRETKDQFPDNDVCRNSLAELLIESEEFKEAEDLLNRTMEDFPDDAHSRTILAKVLIKQRKTEQAESLLNKELGKPQFKNNEAFHRMLNALLAGRYDQDFTWEKPARQRKKTTTKSAQPLDILPDPLYAWAAERAPIIRLAFGFDPDAETRERLTAAARTGSASELAEVALRLLFPGEVAPLDDALRARPGSLALRLLRADKNAEQGRRIAEDAPETRAVLESLYAVSTDSTAWQYRFRAAVLACADLSPPPVWQGEGVLV